MTRSSSSSNGTRCASRPVRGGATRPDRRASRSSSSARPISARLRAKTSRASATGGLTNAAPGAHSLQPLRDDESEVSRAAAHALDRGGHLEGVPALVGQRASLALAGLRVEVLRAGDRPDRSSEAGPCAAGSNLLLDLAL